MLAETTSARLAPRPRYSAFSAGLFESPRRVRQHGVDLAGIRSEVAARGRLAALVLRDLVQQPLEFADIAVDSRLEFAVAAVSVADFLKRLLPLQGVEAAREHIAFAALVALPQLGRSVVVDHARN